MIVSRETKNATAESENRMKVDIGSVAHILAWYGAYYAGDDYTVHVNGILVQLDLNGEQEHDIIDA